MYQLISVLEKKNKENKPYFIAYLAYITEKNCDLINVLVSSDIAEKLKLELNNNKVIDMTKYVKIEFNSYQKAYQPKLVL